jgi:hypothetical protein
MPYSSALRVSRQANFLLAIVMALAASGCAKEKVNCGHGMPRAELRFHVIDDRTGLEWLAAPRAFSLDTVKKLNPDYTVLQADKSLVWSGFSLGNDYSVPASGGDFTTTYFLRLSATDTDTIRAHVVYGNVSDSECFRYAKAVDFQYNGRPAGTFEGGRFYCNGCGTVVAFRKRP